MSIKECPENYESHLKAWEEKHGRFAHSSKPSSWSFCKTGKKEELNLVHTTATAYYLHDPKNIEAEARQFLSRFDPLKNEWLLIYGVGLGYYYQALENWLHGNPKRRIVFAEDDPGVLKAFLSTDIAGKLLQDPQADLFFYEPENLNVYEFDRIIRSFLFHSDFMGSLTSYHTFRRGDFEKFKMLFEFYIHAQEGVATEYLKKGTEFLKSYYTNLLHLDESCNGMALFDQFKGIPAIICSAGPSLRKNAQFLKTLKNKALIFAGGTAMNALNGFECVPHFGCGVDPYSFHFSRIISNIAFETPFFYRSRMNQDAALALHGPRLYLPGAIGYPIAQAIDEQLGYPSLELDDGANVINLSLSIAKALGCNPIICVGLDLAYTEGMSYAPGLKTHAIYDVREQFITKMPYEELLLVRDIYGQPIYSLMKWIIESSWYSSFAKKHPEIKLLNCSGGGIGFQGGETIPLQEAAEKYLSKTYDLDGLITEALYSKTGSKAPHLDKIKEALKGHEESLIACKELLKDFFIHHLEIWNEKVPAPSPPLQELEEKLFQESAYTHFLKTFDEFYQRFMKDEEGSDQKTSLVKELISCRLSYLSELIVESLQMIEQALKQRSEYDEALKREVELPSVPATNAQVFEGQSESETSFYYPSGAKLYTSRWADGVKQGPTQAFTEEGELLFEKGYKDGLEEGTHLYYYRPSGILKSVLNYSAGHLNGPILLYYSNGALFRLSQYQMGKREGKDQVYYLNGNLKLEAEYLDDLPIGTAKSWYEDGRLEKEVVYFAPGEALREKRWDLHGNLLPSPKVPANYIDKVTQTSLELQHSFAGVGEHLSSLMLAVKGSLSPSVKKELENEFQDLNKQLNQLQGIGEKLEQASGIGQVRKEFIWNTPSNQQAIYDYLQSAASPMQESLLKLQWKLKNLMKPPPPPEK
jgi:antitoxin component YwqK of YwqJK toxin-antitoxin module